MSHSVQSLVQLGGEGSWFFHNPPVMKTRQFLVLWLLSACLVGLFAVTAEHRLGRTAAIAMDVIGQYSTDSRPLSVLRLDPVRLQQTLDQGNVVSAVTQLENGWKLQYDEYFRHRLTVQSLTAPQMAERLNRIATITGNRTALIYAISLPNQLELILVSPSGLLLHRRVPAANRQALMETANEFRTTIAQSSSSRRNYLAVGQQMYQWMIAPLAAELERERIDTLVFCLGGGLRSLPLAALHTGQQFLIEQYNLAMIPAFNLLDHDPVRFDGVRVLAMGASEFQQAPPLPAVPLEVETITRLWPGESWLNQQFTTEWLKSRRSRYPFGIVHLATHAQVTAGPIENSYIQFWDKPLRLNRVEELNLHVPVVQLLVLSACNTALGDPQAELGFAGLAVQTGVKASLASLWHVSDAGTLVLMTDFYQQLKTSAIKAEALRKAQLAMLRGEANLRSDRIVQAMPSSLPRSLRSYRNTDFSHPYYWAAFTLIGNPW